MQVNFIELLAACYLGNSFQDLVNLLFKVHVQQPVSLVQHQMLEQLETEALQMIVVFSLGIFGIFSIFGRRGKITTESS